MCRNVVVFLVVLGGALCACEEGSPPDSGDGVIDSDVAPLDVDVTSSDVDAVEDAELPSERSCGLLVCVEGEACCDYACVDVDRDPENCGACGVACDATESCEGGGCRCGVSACGDGDVCCALDGGASCVAVESNPNHCGACGNACGDFERCVSGTCACQAEDGVFEACDAGETCCPGLGCRRLETDVASCGACGVACGAGERCENGACTCGSTLGANGSACGDGASCCGEPAACVPSTDASCTCGTVTCGAGQVCCGVECVRPASDDANCGACGVSCASGEICDGGACVCLEGFADCDGDASNGCESRLDLDVSNCGACGRACSSGELCSRSECVVNCQAGLELCDALCRDLAADVQNCGGCGLGCAGGEVCDGRGSCAASCRVGSVECEGGCRELLSDRAHCGGCGLACGSGRVCDGHGACRTTCQAGYSDCSGSCYDLDASVKNCGGCGLTCPSGEVCNGAGACELSCLPGLEDCGGDCVDLDSSFGHCGGCGLACVPGERCFAGACRPVCPRGQLACLGACVEPLFDPAHCGACGRACAPGADCVEGVCRCGGGTASCADGCVTLASDPANCGGCGVVCGASEACVGGLCTPFSGCPTPLQDCGDGACVDVQSSRFHCGACGQVCGATQVCAAGACACPEGLADCDGDAACETSLASNASHCGACGVACAAGELCEGGSCVCAGNRLDCDSGVAGCETLRDEVNCSVCGDACAAGALCVAGSCRARSHTVATHENASLVIGDDGVVYGFGGDDDGVLGVDPLGRDLLPMAIEGFTGSPAAVDVAMGARHACAVLDTGGVWCWGTVSSPALGCGSASCSSRVPAPVSGLDGVSAKAVQLSAGEGAFGEDFSCALLDSGEVRCWGGNAEGQLGGATQTAGVPQTVTGLDGVSAKAVQIASGDATSCAVLDSGAVWCWGRNDLGQLGRGDSAPATGPVEVSGIDGVSASARAVAVGRNSACAALDSGEVWCWGDNTNPSDFLDIGVSTASPSPLPVLGLGGRVALDIDARRRLFCAHLDSFETWCWGNAEDSAVLGASRSRNNIRVAPQPLPLPDLTQVSPSLAHVLARSRDGSIWAWGLNPEGQLGRPNNAQTTFEPVMMPELTSPGAWGEGDDVACAITGSPSRPVSCWGIATDGQLGYAPPAFSTDFLPPAAPRGILGLDDATALSVGGTSVCALRSAGSVACWGAGISGLSRFGFAAHNLESTTPIDVPGLEPGSGVTVVALDAGGTHDCALLDTGEVRCWGVQNQGQIGDGALSTTHAEPVTVSGIDGVASRASAIALGGAFSCALLDDGSAVCWGSNTWGEVGDGSSTTSILTPTPVSGLDGVGKSVSMIAASHRQACAILSSGAVECWGNETTLPGENRPTPVPIPTLDGAASSATQLALGEDHACALLSDGTVACWGSNASGQLGVEADFLSATARASTPQRVPGIDGVTRSAVAVYAAKAITHVVLDTGEVWSFGLNAGRFANGSVNGSTPLLVEVP